MAKSWEKYLEGDAPGAYPITVTGERGPITMPRLMVDRVLNLALTAAAFKEIETSMASRDTTLTKAMREKMATANETWVETLQAISDLRHFVASPPYTPPAPKPKSKKGKK